MTTDHEAKLAYEAAVESIQELDTTIGPPAASHVYVQTLALMALASHIGGPTTFKMPLGKDWLVQAVLAARDLRLHTIDSAMALTDDLDEMPRLGKRIWWTLFILVRWSASSAANEWMRETLRELGPRDHLCEEDRTTLGETTWNLAREFYVTPVSRSLPNPICRPVVCCRPYLHDDETTCCGDAQRNYLGEDREQYPSRRNCSYSRECEFVSGDRA